MKEGEPVLGGLQINHENAQQNTPGTQPASFASFQNTQSVQAPSQPIQATQPVQPVTPLSTSNLATGGGSSLNQLASQRPALESIQPTQPPAQSQPIQAPTQTQFSQPSQQFSAQPIISNNSDIVLQPESRKNHKKWVIGGILIILCTSLIASLLFIGSRNNEVVTSQNLNKINEKISSFSSTVLYGDGRQIDLSTSTYNSMVDYKFRREVMNGNQEYIKQVINEFDSVNNLIIEDKNLDLTDDDANYLKAYKDKLQFLEIYVEGFNEDYSTIIDKIINNGKEETISYLETQYSKYINSDNSSLRDYFLYKIEYETLATDILLRTNIDKCIVNNVIVLNCETDLPMTEEETLRIQEIQNEMRIIVTTNIKYIINGCWNIYNMVNGANNV